MSPILIAIALAFFFVLGLAAGGLLVGQSCRDKRVQDLAELQEVTITANRALEQGMDLRDAGRQLVNAGDVLLAEYDPRIASDVRADWMAARQAWADAAHPRESWPG